MTKSVPRPALDSWLERSGCLLFDIEAPSDPELVDDLARKSWARLRLDCATEAVIGHGAVMGQGFVSVVVREVGTGRQIGAVLLPAHRFGDLVAELSGLRRHLSPSGR